eukprot:3170241-Pleurochrysis_carterae.AAC.1
MECHVVCLALLLCGARTAAHLHLKQSEMQTCCIGMCCTHICRCTHTGCRSTGAHALFWLADGADAPVQADSGEEEQWRAMVMQAKEAADRDERLLAQVRRQALNSRTLTLTPAHSRSHTRALAHSHSRTRSQLLSADPSCPLDSYPRICPRVYEFALGRRDEARIRDLARAF